MAEHADFADRQAGVDDDILVTAYRHDAHKIVGNAHDTAPETFNGVVVNQRVPHGADGDAAALSRPPGEPEQTVNSHETHFRLSLLTGESRSHPTECSRRRHADAIDTLLTGDDPRAMHRAWLSSDVVSDFNESVYYPYTSLKYHTLLVAALLDNYRAGHAFSGLWLVVDQAGEIRPHRTVYAGERFALRIDADATGQPRARLGSRPWRSWASTWTRLSAHPLAVDSDRDDMVLDANLRRIQCWSTALQYIEDYQREGRP